MMMHTPKPASKLSELEARVVELEQERDYFASLVGAFLEGRVTGSASVLHFILAQWGRKRLESIRSTPALLQGSCGAQPEK